jgi:predicted RNase H-like HicB family nuclease|nr:MAG TPA: antitoxin [Caudoviricetes sp.]
MPSNMKLNAVIERGQDGGFAICVREMPWLLGYGETESEAREDFNDVFKEQVDYFFEKHGKYPDWKNAEISFTYDLTAFFLAFPFINASEFARFVGLNPSLMRKYKQGLASASDKQLYIIQQGLNKFVDHLKSVQF